MTRSADQNGLSINPTVAIQSCTACSLATDETAPVFVRRFYTAPPASPGLGRLNRRSREVSTGPPPIHGVWEVARRQDRFILIGYVEGPSATPRTITGYRGWPQALPAAQKTSSVPVTVRPTEGWSHSTPEKPKSRWVAFSSITCCTHSSDIRHLARPDTISGAVGPMALALWLGLAHAPGEEHCGRQLPKRWTSLWSGCPCRQPPPHTHSAVGGRKGQKVNGDENSLSESLTPETGAVHFLHRRKREPKTSRSVDNAPLDGVLTSVHFHYASRV